MKQLVLCVCVFALSVVVASATPPQRPAESSVLLRCFLRTELINEVSSGRLIPYENAEISAVLAQWGKVRRQHTQLMLSDRFGRNARRDFGEFAETFIESQAENNLGYLERLLTELNFLDLEIETYEDLRAVSAQRWLKRDIEEASDLLSEIQTWVKLKEEGAQPPSLEIWLHRNDDPSAALAAAEVPFGEMPKQSLPKIDALGSFSQRQKERRAKQVEQATADMGQIARERREVEEELAQEELLRAQAEAEAMVRHAQDLAEVEKFALEQRKNGWESKLKKIVKTTISSTVGAFTGELGRRAGEGLADSLFGE